MNAADTNVYVYALDAGEPAKQAKAVDLFDQLMQQPSDTVLVWQVAAEFLNQLRKWEAQGRLATAAVEAAFQRSRAHVHPANSDRGRVSNLLRSSFPLQPVALG